jgi:PAS domain S-box-containing protein
MRVNYFFFLIFFFIVIFFVVLNLFFERSFQKELFELTHRELGLLAQLTASKIETELSNFDKETNEIFELIRSNKLDNINLRRIESTFGYNIDFLSRHALSLKIANKTADTCFIQVNVNGLRLEKICPILPKGQIVKFSLSLSKLFDQTVGQLKIGQKGHGWIILSDGTLLYHPTQPSMIGRNIYTDEKQCFQCHRSFKAERYILSQKTTTGYQIYISPEKEQKLISYSVFKFRDLHWYFCFSIPISDIFSAMEKSVKLHSFIIISIFLVMLLYFAIYYYMNIKNVRTEERLRYYSYLDNIIESIIAKLVVLDRNYNILLCNTSYAKLLKKPKDEIIGRNFFEICPQRFEEYRKTLGEIIDKAFKGQHGSIMEYPLYVDGELRYHHIVINPFVINNEVQGAVIVCDDITEEIKLRKEIENYANKLERLVEERTKQLQIEKEKLDIIMQTIDSGICIINDKGDILWMNKKMEDLIRERKSNNLCDLFCQIGDCIVKDVPTQFVAKFVLNGKLRYLQCQVTPFKAEDGETRYIALIQDITALKQMEEKIAQSEKLSALARLAAGLAHEIGNPLTSISSYVQVLKEHVTDEFSTQALDVILKHIQRISYTIRNISNFSKPSKGELVPTDILEVLQSSLELVKFDKRMKGINVKVECQEIPRVLVDPNQLNQVFINIILNAIDAMPNGGELIVRCKVEDDWVLISFTDTGVGIPQDVLPFIFDPFFTTKEKGTGFGLSVSYSIIKNFGGDILVESEVGKGSTFTIKLPVHKEA